MISAYSEPQRFYHKKNHLIQLFQELDSCDSVSNEILWAAWYHDVIYQPGAKNNEQKSTETATISLVNLGVNKININKIIALILATKNHQGEAADDDTRIFLDADMSILGSEEGAYLEYCDAVRKEHSAVPGFLFKRGRAKFLNSVLVQENIFCSPFFKDKYEEIARKNIKCELHRFNS